MSTIDKLSLPPLIPEDTKYASNETKILKTVSLISDSTTDGIATLSGGTFSGLLYPVNDADVATKQYVDDIIASLGSGAALPVTSVQYAIAGGNFGGDSTFTFASNTLTVDAITDGVATLNGGILSDLLDPVDEQDAATKKYVDSSSIIVQSSINLVSNTTYTATQMVGGLITRTGSSNVLIDLTATAADLVATIPSVKVGSKILFSVINRSTGKIIIAPNLGVTIHNSPGGDLVSSIVLFENYQTNVELVVTNITSGSEAITMFVLNTGYLDNGDITFTNSNFQTQFKNDYLFQRLNIRNDYVFRFNGNNITSNTNYTYSIEDVLDGVARRGGSLTTNRVDTLPEPSEFSAIANGITFIIQNIDPTFYIRLNASSNWSSPTTIGGVSDSTRIISPGKTGIFALNPSDAVFYTLSIN